jgi:hypothetical protein
VRQGKVFCGNCCTAVDGIFLIVSPDGLFVLWKIEHACCLGQGLLYSTRVQALEINTVNLYEGLSLPTIRETLS